MKLLILMILLGSIALTCGEDDVRTVNVEGGDELHFQLLDPTVDEVVILRPVPKYDSRCQNGKVTVFIEDGWYHIRVLEAEGSRLDCSLFLRQ